MFPIRHEKLIAGNIRHDTVIEKSRCGSIPGITHLPKGLTGVAKSDSRSLVKTCTSGGFCLKCLISEAIGA